MQDLNKILQLEDSCMWYGSALFKALKHVSDDLLGGNSSEDKGIPLLDCKVGQVNGSKNDGNWIKSSGQLKKNGVHPRLGILFLMAAHIPLKWILDANSVSWKASYASLKQQLKTSWTTAAYLSSYVPNKHGVILSFANLKKKPSNFM